ncbi:hypothetical protein PUNSTDRAFT_43613 [Punctularia strigosozonata HHB-11173 SS5]|uniref:uncharacterized protein n=1 Tax=Punctularia strigosozonata (strain HHB-11173) TaxID=741275 RepID=UPI00044176E5|nr:uncharacterized protein PUNSTDRAFT_43613 [Punctularia strigosozonata HHB-11173 SS5]EIN10838.1 hypothetical protein PUNSTDRAFT_43613 [Punctularia strigosozonata HHB-11173 SS5]
MALTLHPSKPSVVLYRYDASPFARKISNLLLLKNIPHYEVDVSRAPPRPELSSLLGISYRRIPVLAIGNDVYCDTSLIASVLERAFPPEQGYGTLHPDIRGSKTNPGLLTFEAISTTYAGEKLFQLAVAGLPWEALPDAFIKDRSSFFGAPIDPQAMAARRPTAFSTLSSHLSLLESQLTDGREWLLSTDSPSVADISIHFIYNWIAPFPAVKKSNLLDAHRFPLATAWLSRVSMFLAQSKKAGKGAVTKATGQEAAQLITATSGTVHALTFDAVEAQRLQVTAGMHVAIAPEDTGRNVATYGKLVGLNRSEIVIETKGTEGSVRCHFPRIGFTVKVNENVFSKVVDPVKSKI